MSEQNNNTPAPKDQATDSFFAKITDISSVAKRSSISDKGKAAALKKKPVTQASETDKFVDLITYFMNKSYQDNTTDREYSTDEHHVNNPRGLETNAKQDNEKEVHQFSLGFKSIAAFKNYCAHVSEKAKKCINFVWECTQARVLDVSIREELRFRDMAAVEEMGAWLADNQFHRQEELLIRFDDKNLPIAVFEVKSTSQLSTLDQAIFSDKTSEDSGFKIKHIQLQYVENNAQACELAESFRKMISMTLVDVHVDPKVTVVQGIGPQGFDVSEEVLGNDIMYATPNFYPWMKDTPPEDYIRDFLDSDANILVFYGPPGTGKSTLLRTAIKRLSLSALITTNQDIMRNELFVKYLGTKMSGADGHYDLLIAEDAEAIMGKRTDGNGIMSQILNSASGITVKDNFKLVLTSNLMDLSNVDTALLRHGRCYDIMEFGRLTREQAMRVRADVKKPVVQLKSEHYTLAQAMNIASGTDIVRDMDGNASYIVAPRFSLPSANANKK